MTPVQARVAVVHFAEPFIDPAQPADVLGVTLPTWRLQVSSDEAAGGKPAARRASRQEWMIRPFSQFVVLISRCHWPRNC